MLQGDEISMSQCHNSVNRVPCMGTIINNNNSNDDDNNDNNKYNDDDNDNDDDNNKFSFQLMMSQVQVTCTRLGSNRATSHVSMIVFAILLLGDFLVVFMMSQVRAGQVCMESMLFSTQKCLDSIQETSSLHWKSKSTKAWRQGKRVSTSERCFGTTRLCRLAKIASVDRLGIDWKKLQQCCMYIWYMHV